MVLKDAHTGLGNLCVNMSSAAYSYTTNTLSADDERQSPLNLDHLVGSRGQHDRQGMEVTPLMSSFALLTGGDTSKGRTSSLVHSDWHGLQFSFVRPRESEEVPARIDHCDADFLRSGLGFPQHCFQNFGCARQGQFQAILGVHSSFHHNACFDGLGAVSVVITFVTQILSTRIYLIC